MKKLQLMALSVLAATLACVVCAAPASAAPDRHWELATPPDKLGQPTRALALSPDGGTVRFDNTGGNGLPGTGSQWPSNNSYLARRDAHRWDYVPMNLSASQVGRSLFSDAIESLDLSLFRGITDRATQTSAFFLQRPGAAAVQVTPDIRNRNGPSLNGLPQYYGASSDLKHVVFYARSGDGINDAVVSYLPSDPLPALPGPDNRSPRKIYESVAGDPPLLRRVDVDDLGVPISSCSDVALGSTSRVERAVSADGRRVFFSARPDCSEPAFPGPQHLYMRLDGAHTIDLSTSECARVADPSAMPPVTACAPVVGDAQYESASMDGTRVLFTTPDQLVDGDTDATNDLYRYDVAAPGHHLTLVSAGDSSDVTPGAGADVEGVVRVSDDGARTYFVARGVLTTTANAFGQQAVEGSDNLYVADADTASTTFIATLDGGDAGLWAPDYGRAAQLADPAGRYFVFVSAARLTADDTDNAADVYRYDADAGTLVRISIAHDSYDGGNADLPAAIMFPSNSTSSSPAVISSSRDVTTDGSRIVFGTSEALQADDVNNALDLYEWDDGHVSMVSDGRHPEGIANNSGFLISADGETIAFSTSARLLPDRDTDTAADVYVARLGADVDPLPPGPPASCAGQACQQTGPPPPTAEIAGTVTFTGPGNLGDAVLPPPAATIKVSRSKAIAGSRVALGVTVPRAGRLTLAGSGLKSATRLVAKGGRYVVSAQLTSRASKTLRRTRTLKTRARVTFRPAVGAAVTTSVPLTFRSTSTKKGRS